MESLCTNTPLDTTINVMLRRIYGDKEISTNMQRKDVKDIIILCTENVDWKFYNDIYK